EAIAITTPVTDSAMNAARQPSAPASVGSSAPAIAAPAGTPVCLIENVSAMRDGGVVRASTCEEAGVMGPYPNPITTGASASSTIAVLLADATMAMPTEQMSTA